MIIKPIRKIGASRSASLTTSYEDIILKVGEPNVTDLDDNSKVKASWGFQNEQGRKGFIWAYKWSGKVEECNRWSVDGNLDLISELFGKDKVVL